MTVITLQSESERTRRKEIVRESKAALQQGQTVEQRTRRREDKADEWAAWIHQQMDSSNCIDPVALLPDILAKMEQTVEDRVASEIAGLKAKLAGALK